MTEQRSDTDERGEPAGTPSPGPHDLTARPAIPGDDDAGTTDTGRPTAVPGTYEADDAARERGQAAGPGD